MCSFRKIHFDVRMCSLLSTSCTQMCVLASSTLSAIKYGEANNFVTGVSSWVRTRYPSRHTAKCCVLKCRRYPPLVTVAFTKISGTGNNGFRSTVFGSSGVGSSSTSWNSPNIGSSTGAWCAHISSSLTIGEGAWWATLFFVHGAYSDRANTNQIKSDHNIGRYWLCWIIVINSFLFSGKCIFVCKVIKDVYTIIHNYLLFVNIF